ncbi:aldo/keto reductase family oxidoreductase [Parasegetibacter sp. NRK P23]|uniref:aldo/keto reductase n=1 Tax=Parasegetibacter sp. NRK P23 TaxID=2942999 RepID=UPI0020433B74|nr:aldo/keto reductase [Parasegetibacter sp. NRK P23]MCM5528939.1 aldo/keto reductase [Parasegetibacter sp. NRK P23]
MEKVYVSDSGPKVSPAIYSFWRWSNLSGNGITEMERVVGLCLELGINTFDHAEVYGDYRCEEMFGEVMKRKSFKREDVVLFSKCGTLLPHASRPEIKVAHVNTSASRINESVEASLRKLNTEYLDIFLLDQLDQLSNLEETALALERLKTSGKVKNIGVSNFSVFQHQLLAAYSRIPIVTNHIELNLLHTNALDNGQVDYIKQRYMRPMATSPLADGWIQDGTDEQAVRVRKVLAELGEKYNANIESIAVAWLVKLGALPLIGTSDEDRIRNIANAFSVQLDIQDWYMLYNASKGI